MSQLSLFELHARNFSKFAADRKPASRARGKEGSYIFDDEGSNGPVVHTGEHEATETLGSTTQPRFPAYDRGKVSAVLRLFGANVCEKKLSLDSTNAQQTKTISEG